MKSYTITVNGNTYDVTVEETTGGEVATAPRPKMAPKSMPKAASKPAVSGDAGASGSTKIEAGAAGKVFKIEAQEGQQIKAGAPIIILEAMKMEIPVVSPMDGVVASINVAVGDSVESGALLATLN